MSDQAKIGIAITANDKTAKGFGSVDRRAEKTARKLGQDTAKGFGQIDQAATRSGRSIVGTFARIERASSALVTGGGGISGKLSALASVGEAAGTGLGEAAVAGGLLEGALAALVTPAAIAVGVIGGIALVTDKMVSGWAKGVIGASNLASTVGVATKALQEFQAAGERAGIDKNTSASALGGLSETLNNARYGKNANAAGTLSYLGVHMKLNPDGTVDTAAMLPQIAAAMSKQTSAGARQVASNLGIGEAAIPMFRRGGAWLQNNMADAALHAGVTTDEGEARAKRWTEQRAKLGQLGERMADRAGSGAANLGQGFLDRAVDTATGANDFADRTIASGGHNIVHGAEQFSAAVIDDFRPAVRELSRAISGWSGGGRFDHAKVDRMAHAALPLYRKFLAHGDSPAEAAAWAAAAWAESSGDPHRQQAGKGKNLGYGLFQWDAARRALFRKVMGHDIHGSSADDQISFRDYELGHHERKARRAIDAASGAASKGDAVTRFFERPKYLNRDAADRANLAGTIADAAGNIRHDVHVHLHDKREQTHATVQSRRADGSHVSYAFGRPPS